MYSCVNYLDFFKGAKIHKTCTRGVCICKPIIRRIIKRLNTSQSAWLHIHTALQKQVIFQGSYTIYRLSAQSVFPVPPNIQNRAAFAEAATIANIVIRPNPTRLTIPASTTPSSPFPSSTTPSHTSPAPTSHVAFLNA